MFGQIARDSTSTVLRVDDDAKARLKIMLLAKHAKSGGALSPVDGNHAVYHHELLTTLQSVGFDVVAANSYEEVYDAPPVDFVFTLLNRGGFLNSEILAPLLLTRRGVSFLGASPIVRGLGDDKHLSKAVALQRGVPTMDWAIWRKGGLMGELGFAATKLVVKPNASSASWGLKIIDSWTEAEDHARSLHDEGHDAIIERWMPRNDIAVPVIGGRGGKPYLLPPMLFRPGQEDGPRSYEEKRGLVTPEEEAEDPLQPITEGPLRDRLHRMVELLLPEFWPFDYGRFEFRFDPENDALSFMEVNLSCNLWSKKSISRSARMLGIDHATLVETIVAHSLVRQGLLKENEEGVAA